MRIIQAALGNSSYLYIGCSHSKPWFPYFAFKCRLFDFVRWIVAKWQNIRILFLALLFCNTLLNFKTLQRQFDTPIIFSSMHSSTACMHWWSIVDVCNQLGYFIEDLLRQFVLLRLLVQRKFFCVQFVIILGCGSSGGGGGSLILAPAILIEILLAWEGGEGQTLLAGIHQRS